VAQMEESHQLRARSSPRSTHRERAGRIGNEPLGQSADEQTPTHASVGSGRASIAAGALSGARLPTRGVLSGMVAEVPPDAGSARFEFSLT
jgi:hypothetical protein